MIMGERNGFDEYHIKISPSRSTLRFVLQSFNHDDILQYICSEVFLQSSVLPLSLSIWCRFCIHELHQRTFKLDDTYQRITHFTKRYFPGFWLSVLIFTKKQSLQIFYWLQWMHQIPQKFLFSVLNARIP